MNDYKVGYYLKDKKRNLIFEILDIDFEIKECLIKNVNSDYEPRWNSMKVLDKYLVTFKGYNTPLWKVINE